MAQRNYSALTKQRLHVQSGDCCAYPECPLRLFPEEGNNADICHIEALSPGGPRYNPDSSDEERNAFPNLMLLCKTHHGIIDQVDTAGQPYYNTHQLKQMKQARRDWFEASRATLFSIKTPSLLSKIVHSLSSLQAEPKPANVSHPFKIDAKIDFNALSSRHYGIIHKYSVYYHSVECLYNELEPAQKASLLEAINDIYLSCQRPSISSDDLWDNVESKLIEKLNNESKHEYSEPLEWCVNIIMVDAFMRCKILEEPKV